MLRATMMVSVVAGLMACGVPQPVVTTSVAPHPEEGSIRNVVTSVYDGMRTRDTARMRSAMHTDARLFVTTMRNGAPLVRLVPINTFLQSIGASGEQVNVTHGAPEIRVDGNVATAWTTYTLRRNATLSHCGTSALQFARTPQGWRVLQIFEMQRQDDCR